MEEPGGFAHCRLQGVRHGTKLVGGFLESASPERGLGCCTPREAGGRGVSGLTFEVSVVVGRPARAPSACDLEPMSYEGGFFDPCLGIAQSSKVRDMVADGLHLFVANYTFDGGEYVACWPTEATARRLS